MHFVKKQVSEKRQHFADQLKTGKLLRFPGAYNPLVAKLIEEIGYDGIYVSGGVMANDLGMPDIGLTTLHDVANRSHQIARVTNLPTIIDIDTGFGEAMNVARTIETIETLGISGCHIEDQTNPKRCGHLDNKELVSISEMTKKIKAAVDARKDKNFLIIARTDANAVEGIDKTIVRAKAYIDAGADMIFPEALKDESEFEKMRKSIKAYLLANMTEFGKSKLLTKKELENLGYNLVIYPVTTQRLALKNVEDGLKQIFDEGHQNNVIEKMQTRKRLYELVDYEKYGAFDQSVFNFGTKGHE
jgi:methylisocitrate lyase